MDEVSSPREQPAPTIGISLGRTVIGEIPAVIQGAFQQHAPRTATGAYARFRQDPYYFLRYYVATIGLLGGGIVLNEALFGRLGSLPYPALWLLGLVLFVLPSFSLIFLSGLYFLLLAWIVPPAIVTPASLALIPVGLLAGTVSAALMHNAAHGNFGRTWKNRLWGEVCGLFQLTGFAGWCVSHFIHHAAPDNPDKDAHAPGDISFRDYMSGMGQLMKENLTRNYFEIFGDTSHTRVTWSLVTWLLPLVRYSRILFILSLLGPTAFVLIYVPFKIANTMIYGDFNYRTHRPTANGSYEILNLNHNVWYKLLNAISFGSYFHKNHHRNPSIFNPRIMGHDERPFVTYRR